MSTPVHAGTWTQWSIKETYEQTQFYSSSLIVRVSEAKDRAGLFLDMSSTQKSSRVRVHRVYKLLGRPVEDKSSTFSGG